MTHHTAAALASVATREVRWNVGDTMTAVLYVSMGLALAVFAYGILRRVRVWRLGEPDIAWDRPGVRLNRVLAEAVGHARLRRERTPGGAHALLLVGLIALFLATLVVFVDNDLGYPVMQGAFYLYYQSLTVDLLGLGALAAVIVFAWRRLVSRPARLQASRPGNLILLGALFFILATGFVLEGARLAASADAWDARSPVGYVVARALTALGLAEGTLRDLHRAVWLSHVLLWHLSLATIPFSLALHGLTAPLNLLLADTGSAKGVPTTADFGADPPRIGIGSAIELGRRQLLSLDACTACGRCEQVCPAFIEGKPLSPRRLILDLRDHVRASEAALRAARKALRRGDGERAAALLAGLPRLAGEAIAPETLWACTTCGACVAACPVGVDHVPLVLGLRQHLAMAEAEVPDGVAAAVASLEARAHPFRGISAARDDWYRDLPVVDLGAGHEGKTADVLYWTGCAAVFDERARRVARALVRVLDTAGVQVAVLGNHERCCGDVARRTGNDYVYTLLAEANVATLQACTVQQIVTHCPHCLQALKHEYNLGNSFEILHHSELLHRLLAGGRLRPTAPLAERVTFHDPCYLGRYNGIFAPPREVLDLLGTDRVEMGRSGEQSFCCGAGGGHAFYQDDDDGRIDRNRAREAFETGATTLCTACPFCLNMLETGERAERADRKPMRVRDLAEVLAEALSIGDDVPKIPTV